MKSREQPFITARALFIALDQIPWNYRPDLMVDSPLPQIICSKTEWKLWEGNSVHSQDGCASTRGARGGAQILLNFLEGKVLFKSLTRSKRLRRKWDISNENCTPGDKSTYRHTHTQKKMISWRKDLIQHPSQPLLQYCAPSQEQSSFVFHSARFDRPFIGIKIRNNVIDTKKRKGAMEPSPNAKRFSSFSKNSSNATEDRQTGSSAEQTRLSLVIPDRWNSRCLVAHDHAAILQ